MLNAVVKSFFGIFKKPSLVVPGVFLTLVQAVLFFVFFFLSDTLPRFYYELFVLDIFPKTGIFESIFLLVLGNLEEFVFLAFLAALWFAASLWMIFSYTNVLKKNASPVESTFSPVKHLGKIIGLGVFFVLVLLLYFAVTLFFLWLFVLGGALEMVGLAGIILWLLLGAYLYFKLIFLPVEFFSNEQGITQAIKKTWKWSGKKFFSIVVFVILALAVSNIFIFIGDIASDFIPIELVSIIIIFLSMAFSYAYFGFALVNYYFSRN